MRTATAHATRWLGPGRWLYRDHFLEFVAGLEAGAPGAWSITPRDVPEAVASAPTLVEAREVVDVKLAAEARWVRP